MSLSWQAPILSSISQKTAALFQFHCKQLWGFLWFDLSNSPEEVLDGKLLKFESFVKMGHDVARRLYTAERCRAAPSPIQNKTLITGPGKAMKFCWSCQFEMSNLLYKNLLGHLEVPCCYVAFAVFLLFSIFHLCGFFWLKHSSVMILRRGPPCQQEWHVPCKPQLIGQILSAAITCCQNGSSPISFSSETI